MGYMSCFKYYLELLKIFIQGSTVKFNDKDLDKIAKPYRELYVEIQKELNLHVISDIKDIIVNYV